MDKHQYNLGKAFPLESGEVLPELTVTYHTSGTLNAAKDNVIWICHALTANSDAEDWWEVMVGKGKYFDTDEYFIVCANIIGSCYGSTGPLSINPQTGSPFYLSFPLVTVRDLANAHELLRHHLKVEKIHTLIGGSIGGFQALEWSVINPAVCENLIFIASNARVTPWATAFNESQRLAIRADKTFLEETPAGGAEGLKAARSMALISYRSHAGYCITQHELSNDTLEATKASSYQQYQGQKLANRFDAYSYYTLTRIIDTHNIGRNRGGVKQALSHIKANTLVIGIDSDFLFPIQEQQEVHRYIQNSCFEVISSDFGHDGFLLEWEQLTSVIDRFYVASGTKAEACTENF